MRTFARSGRPPTHAGPINHIPIPLRSSILESGAEWPDVIRLEDGKDLDKPAYLRMDSPALTCYRESLLPFRVGGESRRISDMVLEGIFGRCSVPMAEFPRLQLSVEAIRNASSWR